MGRPRGRTAAATTATADASTMTSAPTLSSKAASTASIPLPPVPPPAAAAAAATAMGSETAEDGGVVVVRIVGHRFVPDYVVLRGRGRTVRWVNEEGDGCVACRFGSEVEPISQLID